MECSTKFCGSTTKRQFAHMTNEELASAIKEVETKVDKMQVTLTRVATIQYVVMFILGSGFTEIMRFVITGHP